ncbi:hypothetical protein EYF80_064875 [Liparis tanakae]|uniref:Uncharacterized protein n=1 Tax=Liparis tanakae TaxID=230148 RepID=A0A4Z2E862_9TELE|nr:hypothetical protein EYF80_064875 [Liparis tanakae]
MEEASPPQDADTPRGCISISFTSFPTRRSRDGAPRLGAASGRQPAVNPEQRLRCREPAASRMLVDPPQSPKEELDQYQDQDQVQDQDQDQDQDQVQDQDQDHDQDQDQD